MPEPPPSERRRQQAPRPGALLFTLLGGGLMAAGALLLFFALRAALALDATDAPAAGWGLRTFLMAAAGAMGLLGGLALLRWPIHEYRPIARCGKCGGEIWHGDQYCSRCAEKVWPG